MSHIDKTALREKHERLKQQLILHEANPELSDQQKLLATAWRDRMDRTKQRLDEPLKVAFLSQVGRGKSTLISVATGLHLDIEGSPQDWSVLPVGDGRTTLGETRIHLEDRDDIELVVEPWPLDTLKQELKYLAEDTWGAEHRRSTGTKGTSEFAGEELHDLLRAWLAPQADNRRAVLRAHARDSETPEALIQRLLSDLDVERRSREFREAFPNTSEGLRVLQKRLRDLMEGELPDAPAPLVTHIHAPKRYGLGNVAAVVDTQGLEPNGASLLIEARPDLQRLLANPNALLVLCTEFEAAPDGVTMNLLKAIVSGDDVSGLGHRFGHVG